MDNHLIRVGVIGCGAIGKEHVERLTNVVSQTKVVAVYDYVEKVADEVAQKYDAKSFASGEELIASNDVDAVVVCSTDETHAGYVVECLKQNKYVFCEKPLALTAKECEEMMAIESEQGHRLLQMGFNRRFDKGYVEMKKAIEAGEVGEPLMIHSAHRNIAQAAGFQTDYAITRVAIHEIDISRWLLNDEYDEVQVLKVKQSKRTSGDWLNPQLMMFTTKSGQRIDVEVQTDGAYAYDIRCQVVGEDGTLDLPDPAAVTKRKNQQVSYGLGDHWASRFADSYDEEFIEWATGILNDQLVGASTWDGYASCVTSDALIQSRKTGQPEKVTMIEQAEIYK
ncbi:Gfo/Idh/MocA family protein [Tetragenococcus halophilus]|uniref:Gfo/Idh/MocA family oxidoreductase n=1 Tax=Tetragenococcus halophilus TaxID=51669 RepID=A0A3G5FIP9_TETHA|nr:Gfo/Idh/MocA family oxidoreductase [Tetragenococcus halophilus]MDN6640925.1 Gfo/Idh/MocA family oxidoreductase [Tetragenococcus sp.]AOF48629.1 inositol 2-dehydrogenase [Tetragenococcus halophilus]AYW50233.1 gfo/Idh/MocA family oxidoreductase [Tetragenococcus halophilus]MCF1602783.1 Gfo/Idh/MocA family oxidoreductase [Tetragenococcus halophilus]MCF1676835.1 Gfo/Idh/MocA family oxidoreductase [Tetragenococcus halophilus]